MAQIQRQKSVIIDSDEDDTIYHHAVRRYTGKQHETQKGKTKANKSSASVPTPKERNTESSSSSEDEPSSSDEVTEARHPYYNYATEKHDVSADSKLIYQRHRLDTQGELDISGPMMLNKAMTMPAALSRVTSNHVSGFRTRDPAQSEAESRQNGTEPFPSLQDQAVQHKENLEDGAMQGDTQARSHGAHPHLPHEQKDTFMSEVGVHGAGAGVGLGNGMHGMAKADTAVTAEVQGICEKIKHILDLRQAYLKVSLQCPGDNPKDDEEWDIYPPPPEPVWSEEKTRPTTNDLDAEMSMSNSMHMPDTGPGGQLREQMSVMSMSGSMYAPLSPTASKRRKAGTHIGEDFVLEEVEMPGIDPEGRTYAPDEGSVFQVYAKDSDEPIANVPTLRDYYLAVDQILDIASDGPAKSFAYRRLQYLEGRYGLYTLLNEYEEVAETKKVPHRDFYNVRKVDTHVHHSACMNQKHLLRFIKSKMKKYPDEVVLDRDGQKLTLSEVFESINLTAYDLSIDTLDMHAHTDSFHRFDKFNLKYNPIGQSRLRDIFLKTDNYVKGRYLADITKEVISDLESSKYQMVEWRISIYARSLEEWDKLAAWVVDNKLFSHNVRWLIQVPRLYSLYKSMKMVESFDEVLKNLFQPLFEVTQDPSSHPKLHIFLQRVIGFDSVDDESKPERRLYRKFPPPKQWNTKQNPPYNYWIYYMFANMTSLNAYRKQRGFNTFLLRPHCGEAGDTDHLAAALLCCYSISHGIMLRKVPLLQYAFYLDQIGIAMSPLSNNALFLTYDRNPFISYFRKGLNVSLSTDDPLQFAFTKEPLIEEYSVAAQIYKLSAVDMCELAKHSVDQCGFELKLKQRWLGKYCYLPGTLGNDVAKCNVPDLREAFRHETLRAEHAFIARYTEDYTHLDRCTPQLPDPSTSDASVQDLYKALESPRQFYATTQTDSRLGRTPSALSMRYTTQQEKISSTHPQQQQQQQQVTAEPLVRTTSPIQRKASTLFQTHAQSPIPTADTHISADLPKAFPGLHHQRHRRRSTRQTRASSSAAVTNTPATGVGSVTGNTTGAGTGTGTATDTEDTPNSAGRLSGSISDLSMNTPVQLQKPERMRKAVAVGDSIAGTSTSTGAGAGVAAGPQPNIKEESDSE